MQQKKKIQAISQKKCGKRLKEGYKKRLLLLYDDEKRKRDRPFCLKKVVTIVGVLNIVQEFPVLDIKLIQLLLSSFQELG
jgi:PHP family Zn ribbon phosphoesterase